MQTLAGLILALLGLLLLSAIAKGRGREWLRAKFLGEQ